MADPEPTEVVEPIRGFTRRQTNSLSERLELLQKEFNDRLIEVRKAIDELRSKL